MNSEEIIQILRSSKERLFTKGWKKGAMGGKEGPNCLVGAINQEIGLTSSPYLVSGETWEVAKPISNILGGVTLLSVSRYNDHVDTTFDDIVDLLDQAIKNLEG